MKKSQPKSTAPKSKRKERGHSCPPSSASELSSGQKGSRPETKVSAPSADSGVAKFVPVEPLKELLPYQHDWVEDEARFKFGLLARQTGKDFSAAAEGIRDIFLKAKRGDKTTWLIAAPSERQSLESLAKWRGWAEAFKFAIADSLEEREDPRNSESRLKSATILFPGGSRVIAVPGRPDTVRGFSANVLLTEFAFFEEPDLTWRAILPSITNPLQGGVKKCRLITTPNGIGNKAHQLWTQNYSQSSSSSSSSSSSVPKNKWSCHKVTIYDAVARGLQIDVNELREALNDPEGWAQEYELEFIDQSTVLLPYDLIAACENPLATSMADPAYWLTTGGPPLVLGIDFGRKRDLTVSWAIETEGGAFKMTKEVLELERVSTPEQVELLRPRIRKARKACLDYTGGGVGLGDYLVKEFGEWNPEQHKFGKIELCSFTNSLKVDIFPKLRMEMERRLVGIPVSRAIREDLHTISRVALAGGGVTYKAPHTADGHADRCTALALAIRAATSSASRPFEYSRVPVPEGSRLSDRDIGVGRFTRDIDYL